MVFVPDWGEVWTRISYRDTMWFLVALTFGLILLSLLVRSRATLRFDLRTTLYLQRMHGPWRDRLARFFTWMGNAPTLIVLAVVATGICLWQGKPYAATFIFASLFALPINAVLKKFFKRERPGEKEVKVHEGPRWGKSYPSGHAMGSTSVYGSIGFYFWILVPDSTIRYSLVGFFFLIPVLVSISRVHLGAHWVSDVVGGIAGGLIVVTLIAAAYPLR